MAGRGFVHYYYGDGKGKTTAALGLAMRFAGQGGKVIIVQFLKNTHSSELESLKKLDNIMLLRGKSGEGFTFSMTPQQLEETGRIHEQNLSCAVNELTDGSLLILDEAVDAVQTGTLGEELLREALAYKNCGCEIVITGHELVDWIAECSDYVTEMKKQKHPFDSGITARKGIEF